MGVPNTKNRVGMTVSGTPGTGTITLNAADTGYQSFATAYGANANVDVLIVDGTAWEVARDCTYTHSGTTLSRGTLEASSTGSALSLTSAAKVYVTETGQRLHFARNRGVVRVTSDGSTSQTISTATFTKLTSALATEVIDQEGWWDHTNKKFLPTRPGKYLICVGAGVVNASDGKTLIVLIYKNGAAYTMAARGWASAANAHLILTGSTIMEMNGSTDYAEIYIYHSQGADLGTSTEVERISFQAFWIGD